MRLTGAVALLATGAMMAPTGSAFAAPTEPDWAATAYRGGVEVVSDPTADQQILDGTAFDDKNRNSTQESAEPGLPGVTVTNGRDVVTTDAQGRYELPAFDNMTVFVTQPRGYQVPVDANNVAQFFYHHLPAGSPKLKYGGIAPTGALPDKVNFPLAKSQLTQSPEQHCVVGADVQTYNQKEVEFARAGVFTDLAARSDYAGCGALFIGDIVGDDLSLYSQTRELTSVLNGKAHVVALSNIQYPTVIPAKKGSYAYGLGERQLEWLRQDIASVPKNQAIVIASHAPLLEFFYSSGYTHAEVGEIYEILKGREVVSLAGHTHMSENLRKGDLTAGWAEKLGEAGLPFTHLTVPAVSGQWYNGRVLEEGFPTAVQRDGTPPGVLTLDIKNTEIRERFTATGDDGSDQMALGINSPTYRAWFDEYQAKRGKAPAPENPNGVTQGELSETWLTTNFWIPPPGPRWRYPSTVARPPRPPVRSR